MTDCRSRLLVIPTVLLLASGCGSSGSTIENRQPDPEEEVADSGGVGEVAELPEPDIGPELPPVELPHEVAEETGGPACAPGEGCFLDSCDENAACQSGWCVDHMGAGVCTIACEEDCPPGWSCQQVGSGPDVTYVCIANHANLCRPCGSGDNCKSPGGAEDVCVDYGAEGSFCGGVCETDEDCPWGFSCVDGLTVDGIATRQCVADAGVCPCTKKSIELALWTPCARANEWGECTGQRICTQEGLSACDAAEPMPETCNGLDDDCDGQIDEPEQVEGEYVSLCFDGNPCTKDQCGGADGCSNAPMDQGECIV
ncbi:MAG: hypothetical protein FJ109_12475, partial [Deltaproteobacteria bacterium]|nr:hypothetical protein [Deltaproteobacteria bacterium]